MAKEKAKDTSNAATQSFKSPKHSYNTITISYDKSEKHKISLHVEEPWDWYYWLKRDPQIFRQAIIWIMKRYDKRILTPIEIRNEKRAVIRWTNVLAALTHDYFQAKAETIGIHKRYKQRFCVIENLCIILNKVIPAYRMIFQQYKIKDFPPLNDNSFNAVQARIDKMVKTGRTIVKDTIKQLRQYPDPKIRFWRIPPDVLSYSDANEYDQRSFIINSYEDLKTIIEKKDQFSQILHSIMLVWNYPDFANNNLMKLKYVKDCYKTLASIKPYSEMFSIICKTNGWQDYRGYFYLANFPTAMNNRLEIANFLRVQAIDHTGGSAPNTPEDKEEEQASPADRIDQEVGDLFSSLSVQSQE